MGMGLVDKVRTLQRYLVEGSTRNATRDRLLDFVLLDAARSGLKARTLRDVEKLGVIVIDTALITDASAPYLDDERLAEALLSLV
jgi:hypothetical protein